MAEIITGLCPVDDSEVLIPDNPLEINPPGYEEDGILDGVMDPDGSIIAKQDLYAATGACPNWICDTPPELYCPDEFEGFPVGPPIISECIKEPSVTGNGYNAIDTPTGFVFVNSTVLYKKNYDGTTAWGYGMSDVAQDLRGLFYIEEYDQILVGARGIDDTPYGKHSIVVFLINCSDGAIVKTFSTIDSWGTVDYYTSWHIGYHNGGVYLAGTFTYQDQYNSARFGYMEWNYNTGEHTQTKAVITHRSDDYNKVSLVIIPETNMMLVGICNHRASSPGPYDYWGQLYKVDLTDHSSEYITQGTLGEEGVSSNSQYFATRLHLTKNYIIVANGFYYSQTHEVSCHQLMAKYSDRFDLYDRTTLEYVKTVMAPVPNTGIYGLGFGWTVSEYGNYILVGSQGEGYEDTAQLYGYGAVYLYDTYFTLINKFQPTPPAEEHDQWGYLVHMNEDTIFYSNDDPYAAKYQMRCSYTNYSLT